MRMTEHPSSGVASPGTGRRVSVDPTEDETTNATYSKPSSFRHPTCTTTVHDPIEASRRGPVVGGNPQQRGRETAKGSPFPRPTPERAVPWRAN